VKGVTIVAHVSKTLKTTWPG